MKKKIIYIILVILLILPLAGCSDRAQQADGPGSAGTKYTMYIGLNDKDTYIQEIPTEEASDMVAEIALKYVSGFTQYQARGAYTDDEGVVTYENSLILVFYDVSQEQIESIMNEVLEQLNQNSVLIEKQLVDYEFYEGTR